LSVVRWKKQRGNNQANSTFGEIKHQTSFEDAVFEDFGDDTQGYQSTSFLVGVQFGF